MENKTIDKQINSILHLNLQDRIYLYQMLWQSILKDMQAEIMPLSKKQKAEIDRRLDRIEKGEAKLFSWEEVKNEIKAAL